MAQLNIKGELVKDWLVDNAIKMIKKDNAINMIKKDKSAVIELKWFLK